MSIVTLKRKSEARYFPHSVQGVGFSLNGTTRFQGVGNTRLGRSVTRTPFKGALPVGHGGGGRCRVLGVKGRSDRCDSVNEYPVQIIRSGEEVPQTEVKRSTWNTPALLESRVNMQMLNRQGCHWVKPSTLDESQLLRISIAETEPVVCDATKNKSTCFVKQTGNTNYNRPFKPLGVTKALPGPLSYDVLYMRRDWKTRTCALPSWPPRRNNSTCADGNKFPSVEETTHPCQQN
jgi:hypothetical protein